MSEDIKTTPAPAKPAKNKAPERPKLPRISMEDLAWGLYDDFLLNRPHDKYPNKVDRAKTYAKHYFGEKSGEFLQFFKTNMQKWLEQEPRKVTPERKNEITSIIKQL